MAIHSLPDELLVKISGLLHCCQERINFTVTCKRMNSCKQHGHDFLCRLGQVFLSRRQVERGLTAVKLSHNVITHCHFTGRTLWYTWWFKKDGRWKGTNSVWSDDLGYVIRKCWQYSEPSR